MSNKQNNKIVIFDWGGVVESHREGEYNWQIARINLIRRLTQIPYTKEEIISKWKQCDQDVNGKLIDEVSGINIEKWFQRLKKEFNLTCNMDEFKKVYIEEFDKVYYYKDVVEYAHSLKNKCKIGILSNLTAFDKDRIDKQMNLSKFDYVWLSYELKYRKPEIEIYEIVEKTSGISTKNILFIDDLDRNLKIPNIRGWNTCKASGYELDKIKEEVEVFLNK